MRGLIAFGRDPVAEVPADGVAWAHVAEAVNGEWLILLRQDWSDRDIKTTGASGVINHGEGHAGCGRLTQFIGDDHGD